MPDPDAIVLSILIPDLDSPSVDRTLAALAAQGAPGPGIEVVVVGKDAPGKVPRERTGSGLRFVETAERLNPAAARNRAVEVARGSRLLFVDADCRPAPGWVQALAAALDRAPIAGGAVDFPRFRRGGDRWALADNIASFHELLADRPAEADSRRPLGSLNLAVRRDAWERVGPFDEALTTSEDHDWVLRARKLGLATAFVPEARVEHAAVRASRHSLVEHATWYGAHFHAFRARHPEAFATGPTWASRRRLAWTAPVKAITGSLAIFFHHRQALAGCLPALPGVIAFRRAWYRSVLASWPAPPLPSSDRPSSPPR